MASKGGNFLLDNIEKIILPVVGVVCLWLLITRVIMTPVVVEYNGRKVSPGDIDRRIEKNTTELVRRLGEEPTPTKVIQSRLGGYVAELNDPLKIDTSLWPMVPSWRSEDDSDGRQYAVPEAPVITDASAGRIRAMAYFPKQEVTEENTYDTVETEPNDLDMVTVEAKLDVSGLCKGFYENFAGSSVRPEWRDPCLARPVFAAVELQRSQKLEDSSWGDWRDVPRLKVDSMRAMLGVIENVNDLPRGGMKVRLLQYDNPAVMSDVLQPRPYDIASAAEDWFPPSLHKKYISLLKEQQALERREEMEAAKEERDRALQEARRSRSESRSSMREAARSSQVEAGGGSGGGGPSSYDSLMGGGGGGQVERPERPTRSREDRNQQREELRRRREEGKETVDDVYSQLEEIYIKDTAKLDENTESLLFWSHDDTVEPGGTYRYRIRLGVFNPLAGTNKLKSGNESYKDKVIIWSNFAEAGTIEVPARLYFFAKDIREATDTILVEVFRYAMGYWYNKEYMVGAGEVIGRVDEPEKPKEDEDTNKQQKVENILIPEKVDFGTEAVMVDAVAVDVWTGGKILNPRNYFEMYYSYDGSSIESMPVRQRFWSADMQGIYNEIRGTMKLPKQPPRPRGGVTQGPGLRPGTPIGPGRRSTEPSYDELMRTK